MIRLSLLLLAVLGLASTASAQRVLMERGSLYLGSGVGFTQPLGQDDAGGGLAYSARGRVGLSRRFAAELGFQLLDAGDGSSPSGATLPGPRPTSFMLDLLHRSEPLGFATVVHAGLGFSSLGLPTSVDPGQRFSWNLGLGVEFEWGPLHWQAGPHLLVIDGGGGSRSFAGFRLGALYGI